MATTSFDKLIVIKDDKVACVLLTCTRITPRRTPSYRLIKREELVKKNVNILTYQQETV